MWHFIWIISFYLFGTQFAFGESVAVLKLSEGSSSFIPAQKSSWKNKGYLKYQATKYTSSIPNQEELDTSHEISARIELKKSSDRLSFGTDVYSAKYMDWGYSNFSVQELFAELPLDPEQTGEIALGRKIYRWNQLDETWSLGIFQPQSEEDGLNIRKQGLAGLFYRQQLGRLEILGFYSSLFIPTMGPNVREDNGALVSDSRWHREPARTGKVLGKDIPIYYSVDLSDLNSLVRQNGFGFRVAAQPDKKGAWAELSLTRKPINKLPVRYNANEVLSGGVSATPSGKVILKPVAITSTTWGGSLGFSSDLIGIHTSWIEDRPDQRVPPFEEGKDWIQQQPGAMQMWGSSLEWYLTGRDEHRRKTLALDYINVREELTADFDRFGLEVSSIFPYRSQFQNALQLRAEIQAQFFQWQSKYNLRILREFDQKGNLVGASTQVVPFKNWEVLIGFDLIGVDQNTQENTDERFLNKFRANDRVFSGVSYVF